MKGMKYIQLLVFSLIVCLTGCREELTEEGTFKGQFRLDCRIETSTLNGMEVASRNTADIINPEPAESEIKDGILLFFFESDKLGEGVYAGYRKVEATDISQNVDGAIFLTTDLATLDGRSTGGLDFSNKDYDVLALANYTANLEKTEGELHSNLNNQKFSNAKYLFIQARKDTIITPLLMSDQTRYEHKAKQLTVSLKRAVSKVVISKAQNVSNFTIKTVQLYNGRDSLYAFDCRGEYPSEPVATSHLVTAPAEQDNYKFVLYDFETHSETVNTDARSALCAIIGATLEGLGEQMYYYRVNIGTRNNRQRVHRNSIYQITVVNIFGPGAITPEESVDSDVNLVEISEPSWNENYDGMYTYAANGIGFAFDRNIIEHYTAEVSSESPHRDELPFYWKNTAGKVLSHSEYPAKTEVSASVSVAGNDGQRSTPIRVEVMDGQGDLLGKAAKLKITVTGYFDDATVTVTYTPASSGKKYDSVTKKLKLSLYPYRVGPIRFENQDVLASFVLDKENFGGNNSFYAYDAALGTCPKGMRPMSLLESMFILSGSKQSKSDDVLYYVDPQTLTQLLLPYTGYKVNDTPQEVNTSAYFWTSSVGMNSDGNNFSLTYFYGSKGSFFPVAQNYSSSADANKKFPMRCIRPAMDPTTVQDGTSTDSPGTHTQPTDFRGYIYKTYQEVISSPQEKAYVEALLKKKTGLSSISLPNSDLPVAIPELYATEPPTIEGTPTKVPQRDEFSMIVVGAYASYTLPGGYRYATEDEIKKILFQGTTFYKPILPINGYGSLIVIGKAEQQRAGISRQNEKYKVFIEDSGATHKMWKKGADMTLSEIQQRRHIYFIVEDNSIPQ